MCQLQLRLAHKVTSNEIRNLLGNSKAQPVALRVHLSRCGVGRLEEVLEQVLLVDIVHSNAKVTD